jgi:hypothetical protein
VVDVEVMAVEKEEKTREEELKVEAEVMAVEKNGG